MRLILIASASLLIAVPAHAAPARVPPTPRILTDPAMADQLGRMMGAMAKAVIADGRALESEADSIDPGLRSTIVNELDIFGGKWDRMANNKEFFALNLQRRHDTAIWRELAEGYRMLADAEECTIWLESRQDIPAPHFNYLFDACAAAGDAVYTIDQTRSQTGP
jgi:hypothetical protein